MHLFNNKVAYCNTYFTAFRLLPTCYYIKYFTFLRLLIVNKLVVLNILFSTFYWELNNDYFLSDMLHSSDYWLQICCCIQYFTIFSLLKTNKLFVVSCYLQQIIDFVEHRIACDYCGEDRPLANHPDDVAKSAHLDFLLSKGRCVFGRNNIVTKVGDYFLYFLGCIIAVI